VTVTLERAAAASARGVLYSTALIYVTVERIPLSIVK
jgi:hypothetical protein